MLDWAGLKTEPPSSAEFPVAAVLVALYPDGDEIRLILTKRPMTMPTHAGHLAFPGGRPDPSDDGPVTTALREAQEEVGIESEQVEVMGFLSEIHTVEFSLLVVPVVGWLATPPILRVSEREVDKVLTPTVDELRDDSGWRFEWWDRRKVWFFEIEGEVLWGATARMTRELLGMAS